MKATRILLIVLAVSLLAAFMVNPATGEEEEYFNYKVVGVAKGKTLKIMSKPDPKSEVLGELYLDSPCVSSKDETVKVGDTEWIKIFSAWAEGWVPKKNLKRVEAEECEGFSD